LPWRAVSPGRAPKPATKSRRAGCPALRVRSWCASGVATLNCILPRTSPIAIWQYWQITGDDDFMAEIRRAHPAGDVRASGRAVSSRTGPLFQGQFSISDVIGPDEYHDHVDNNAFTNRMVAWHLRRAIGDPGLATYRSAPGQCRANLRNVNWICPKRSPSNTGRLLPTIWSCTEDPETGLIEQFDGFFQRKEVDWANAMLSVQSSMQATPGHRGRQRASGAQTARCDFVADAAARRSTKRRSVAAPTGITTCPAQITPMDRRWGQPSTPGLPVLWGCLS
jgi:hypothetical protein